jgi:hypothetical protein
MFCGISMAAATKHGGRQSKDFAGKARHRQKARLACFFLRHEAAGPSNIGRLLPEQ